MWWDNDTQSDYLNFQSVADTVADLLLNAGEVPISVGVSGSWGTGKSSLLNLIHHSISEREEAESSKRPVFVTFNAWLYQGFDDARAALMEAIAQTLKEEADAKKTGTTRARELVSNINWIRLARAVTAPTAQLASGNPLGAMQALLQQLPDGPGDAGRQPADQLGGSGTQIQHTPPQYIQAIREQFEEALAALDIKLIVLIDDLDRCLPETTISTLEAMRLFLFLRNSGFVIAADTDMIRHAVAQHFNADESSGLVTSYFDKLVQVPVSVPNLGTHDVRAYMMLLEVERTVTDAETLEWIRKETCSRLAESWKGVRVDRPFFEEIVPGCDETLLARLDMVDRLAPIMARSTQIAGNPRLVKRFMNAISIRMKVAQNHGIGVDEQVIAKMHLFERCAPPGLFSELQQNVLAHPDGRPHILKAHEGSVAKGEEMSLEGAWDNDFVREWIGLPPMLAERDLRGVLYLSRDYSALVGTESDLSPEAGELLRAFLESPRSAAQLQDQLRGVSAPDRSKIMERLLARANEKTSWGVPNILHPLLAVAKAEPAEGQKLARFLRSRPATQISPSIVPKIASMPWATDVFAAWREAEDVSPAVKRAIQERGG